MADISALWCWRLMGDPPERVRAGKRLPVESGGLLGTPASREELCAETATAKEELERVAPGIGVALGWGPGNASIFTEDGERDGRWRFAVSERRTYCERAEDVFTLCRKPYPAGAFVQVTEHVCLPVPAMLVVQMARELSLEETILIGDELCGTYTMRVDGGGRPVRRGHPLTTPRGIAEMAERAGRMRGAPQARRAAKYVVGGAASVREAALEMMMCLPRGMGGYGLERPVMNYEVSVPARVAERAGCPERRAAVLDLAWPEERVDVEYDGAEWHEMEAGEGDWPRTRALEMLGWRVARFDYRAFEQQGLLDACIRDVAELLGARLRVPSDEGNVRRQELFWRLTHLGERGVFRDYGG